MSFFDLVSADIDISKFLDCLSISFVLLKVASSWRHGVTHKNNTKYRGLSFSKSAKKIMDPTKYNDFIRVMCGGYFGIKWFKNYVPYLVSKNFDMKVKKHLVQFLSFFQIFRAFQCAYKTYGAWNVSVKVCKQKTLTENLYRINAWGKL